MTLTDREKYMYWMGYLAAFLEYLVHQQPKREAEAVDIISECSTRLEEKILSSNTLVDTQLLLNLIQEFQKTDYVMDILKEICEEKGILPDEFFKNRKKQI